MIFLLTKIQYEWYNSKKGKEGETYSNEHELMQSEGVASTGVADQNTETDIFILVDELATCTMNVLSLSQTDQLTQITPTSTVLIHPEWMMGS